LDFANDDPMITPLSPPLLPSPIHTYDHVEDSRRAKRRKLDSERAVAGCRRFCYGRYGQIEPGRLPMQIVSCDGGIYTEGPSYVAENILRNDDSVYCTKGNRCNIVLRHQGTTAFSLKELVIKAPGSHYSNPYVSPRPVPLLKAAAAAAAGTIAAPGRWLILLPGYERA